MNLLDVFDDISDELSESKLCLYEKETSGLVSHDASFDSNTSYIQPGQRLPSRHTPDMFTPSSRGSMATTSTSNKVPLLCHKITALQLARERLSTVVVDSQIFQNSFKSIPRICFVVPA